MTYASTIPASPRCCSILVDRFLGNLSRLLAFSLTLCDKWHNVMQLRSLNYISWATTYRHNYVFVYISLTAL